MFAALERPDPSLPGAVRHDREHLNEAAAISPGRRFRVDRHCPGRVHAERAARPGDPSASGHPQDQARRPSSRRRTGLSTVTSGPIREPTAYRCVAGRRLSACPTRHAGASAAGLITSRAAASPTERMILLWPAGWCGKAPRHLGSGTPCRCSPMSGRTTRSATSSRWSPTCAARRGNLPAVSWITPSAANSTRRRFRPTSKASPLVTGARARRPLRSASRRTPAPCGLIRGADQAFRPVPRVGFEPTLDGF
jgi:hypothetical protein